MRLEGINNSIPSLPNSPVVGAPESPMAPVPAQTPTPNGPQLNFYPSYVTFYGPGSRTVTFRNDGDATLRIRNISPSPNPPFSVSDLQLDIPPGDSRTLTITYSTYIRQCSSGSVSFTTNDPNRGAGYITLSAS